MKKLYINNIFLTIFHNDIEFLKQILQFGSLTLRVLRGGNSAGFLILRIREPFFSVKFFRFILWHM